jgi:adenosylhomocysteine nucleosidase|tara:strand:- start:52 stop:588 length:537 start_codon:yes stop_codon:yes gene_type:complete
MKYVLVALKDELDGHNMNEGEYMVWYTGVGKINATIYATLACLSKDCTEVINYGTAGSQKKEHVGNLLKVGICHQRDMDARPTAELGITPYEATGLEGPLKIDDKGASLSTGDNFVTDKQLFVTDCIDMEGYAIAKVCAAFKKKCTIYKYVSDLADSNAAEHWSENLSKGKDAFLSTV